MLIISVTEELIYRGVILNRTLEFIKNKHIAILLTGILFTALHPSLLFEADYQRVMVIFVFSLILGYGVIYFKNILFGIFAHSAMNAVYLVMPAILKAYG